MLPPNSAGTEKPPHVILIEDETVFRQLLKRSLEKRKGWKMVEDYADGAVGLQACLENPPELLLVDLQLPGKHGLEIVSELLQVHKDVKVLVLTGHAEPSLPGKLMRLGVAGFVDKTAPLAYEVASDLDLSTRTVEKHRANIMEKLGVREVASLVRWVMQNGLG